jgi:hypothetical protein
MLWRKLPRAGRHYSSRLDQLCHSACDRFPHDMPGGLAGLSRDGALIPSWPDEGVNRVQAKEGLQEGVLEGCGQGPVYAVRGAQ